MCLRRLDDRISELRAERRIVPPWRQHKAWFEMLCDGFMERQDANAFVVGVEVQFNRSSKWIVCLSNRVMCMFQFAVHCFSVAWRDMDGAPLRLELVSNMVEDLEAERWRQGENAHCC